MANELEVKETCKFTTECCIETKHFCDTLGATLSVVLIENGLNPRVPTNIIDHNQSYDIVVCVDLTANFKKIYCGTWCVNVAVESCGPGREFSLPSKKFEMTNCRPDDNCVTFTVKGREFESPDSNHCGEVFNICVSVVALDCAGIPIGIAGYCELGPVMVYYAGHYCWQ